MILYLLPITYIILNRKPPLHVVCYLALSFIPLGLNFFIKDFNCFDHFSIWIDSVIHFSVRDKLIDYVNNAYDKETTSIINLFIFNKKDDYSYDIYKKVGNLSISYLIVISGFHLNMLKRVIKKVVYKPKILAEALSICAILFYTYLLNFSTSTSRVLISMIIGDLLPKNKNRYTKTACTGILSLIICPKIIKDIGFNLSYICTFCVIYILSYQIKNFFINQILICFTCTMVSLPFIANINNQMNLFAVINSLLFTYFINISFIILILIFLIKWIYPVQKYLCWFTTNVITAFNVLNISINLTTWKFYLQSLYIWLFISIAIIIKRYTKQVN